MPTISANMLPGWHPAQEEILLTQLAGNTKVQPTMAGYVTLTGQLQINALQHTITNLPIHTDLFRYVFDSHRFGAVASFSDAPDALLMTVLDLTGVPNPRWEADVWLRQQVNKPLPEPHNAEFVLLAIADNEHRLFVRCHSLLFDDTGFNLLLRHIANEYSRQVTNQPETELVYAYSKEIAPARLYLTSLAYTEDRYYWEKNLPEWSRPLLRRQHPTAIGAGVVSLPLSDELSQLMMRITTETASATESLLLTALTLCFARTTHQNACLFGRTVAGRQTKTQRETMGRFDRTLPFLATYTPGQSLRKMIRLVRNQHRADNGHRMFPVEEFARLLGRDLATEPLTDVLLTQVPHDSSIQFAGLDHQVRRINGQTATVPLQLFWQDARPDEPAQIQATFQLAYMCEEEGKLLLNRLHHVLMQFEQRLDEPVSAIDVLPAAQSAYRPWPSVFGGQSPAVSFQSSVLCLRRVSDLTAY